MSRFTYKHTFRAASTGYIVQAVVNNLAPLLFIAFQTDFDFTRLQITFIITLNFLIQLSVDLLSTVFVDRIGYRAAAVLSQGLAAAGLVGMGTLPYLFSSAYAGLLTAVVLCALGGGMLEVIISPIVEALPSDSKSSSMSLLHSFYCWGCVLVILLSTVYFGVAGIAAWRWLPLLWALLPLANLVFFLLVPIRTLLEQNEAATPIRSLLKNRLFWVLFILMLCSGASELAMSQWASLFAETGLGVSKTLGDLLGPCFFAVLMGLGRAFFGAKDRGIPLEKIIAASAFLCIGSYLLASLSSSAFLSLLGCALCGLSVAIFWPGVFSLSAKAFPKGGTALFALLALAGDLGCSFGPSVVGWVSDTAAGGLKTGLLAAAIFPAVLLPALVLYRRSLKKAD